MKPINFAGIILMVPEYAKFVTKDSNGNIYAFEQKPELFKSGMHEMYIATGQSEWLMHVKSDPVYLEIHD